MSLQFTVKGKIAAVSKYCRCYHYHQEKFSKAPTITT